MDSSTVLSLGLKEILCSLAFEKASSNSRVSHISSSPSLFLALFQFWHHGLGKRSLPPTFPSGRSAVPSQFLIDSSHFYSHSRNIQLLFVHRYLWLRIGRIRNLEGIFPTPNSNFSKYVFTRVDHSLNIEYSHSFRRGKTTLLVLVLSLRWHATTFIRMLSVVFWGFRQRMKKLWEHLISRKGLVD